VAIILISTSINKRRASTKTECTCIATGHAIEVHVYGATTTAAAATTTTSAVEVAAVKTFNYQLK